MTDDQIQISFEMTMMMIRDAHDSKFSNYKNVTIFMKKPNGKAEKKTKDFLEIKFDIISK